MPDPTTLGLPQDSEAPEARARPDAATHENGRNLRRSMRRNRRTLAAVTQELEHAAQEAAGWSKAEVASHLILFLYTLARIVANFCFGGMAHEKYWWWVSNQDLVFTMYALDGILRPLISAIGVYCFIRRNTRFSSKSRLHIWGRRTMFCIALFLQDDSIVLNVESLGAACFFVWYGLANLLQIQITNLKLRVLGLRSLSRMCEVLTAISTACVLGMVLFSSQGEGYVTDHLPLIGSFAPVGVVLVIQCLCLISVASAALRRAKGEEGVGCAVSCLYVNASLVVLGPALSIWSGLSWLYDRSYSLNYPDPSGVPWGWIIPILDVGLQTVFVLLMCGMIGPGGWDRPMETFRKLADLSGFGLAAKRIAFPGKIILSALDCIVSFPGKYSKEWDAAVSSTRQANGCSLACVFLTDRASGLGCHADNPDTPGQCWCHTIYGELPASAYLMVIDVHDETNGPITEEVLAFKRADAAAMGLVLVIKEHQTELQWQSELSQAFKAAEELCQQNGCRAPWGCSWFEEWRKNLEEAVRLGQILHVFYFEGQSGPWKARVAEALR